VVALLFLLLSLLSFKVDGSISERVFGGVKRKGSHGGAWRSWEFSEGRMVDACKHRGVLFRVSPTKTIHIGGCWTTQRGSVFKGWGGAVEWDGMNEWTGF